MLQSLWPQILTKLRSPPPGVNLGSLPSMLGGFDKVVFENSTPSDKPTALGFVSNKDANQNGKIDSIHFVIPNIEKALREQGVKLSSSADLEGENLHKLLFFFGHLLSHELAHIKDYQHGADSPFPGGENPAEQKAREFESQFRVAANIRKSIDTVYRGSNMNSKFSGKSIANNSKLAASGKNFISKTARLLKKADADFGQSFPDEMLPYVDETDPASLPENISPTLPEEKSAPPHGMAPTKPVAHPISKIPAPKPNETVREIQKLLDMPKQNGLWDADATQGYWRHFIDENYDGKYKDIIKENWAAGAASLGYEKTPEGMLNFMKNIELKQIAQPGPVTTAGLNKRFISKKAQQDYSSPSVSERLYSQIDSALKNKTPSGSSLEGKPEEIYQTYEDFEGGPKYDMRQDLSQPNTSSFVEKDSVVRISPNLPQQLIPGSLRDGVLNQKGELARCLKEKNNYKSFNELSHLLDASFIAASEKLKVNGVLSPRVPPILKGFMDKGDLTPLLEFVKANGSLRVKYLPKASVNDFTLDAGMMSILKEMRSKAIRLGQMLSECSESLAKRTYDDASIPEAKPSSVKPEPTKAPLSKGQSILSQFQKFIGVPQPLESSWGPMTERAWKHFVNQNIKNEDSKKKLLSAPWSNAANQNASASAYASSIVGEKYSPNLMGAFEFAKDLKMNADIRNLFEKSDQLIDPINKPSDAKSAIASSKKMMSKKSYYTGLTPEDYSASRDVDEKLKKLTEKQRQDKAQALLTDPSERTRILKVRFSQYSMEPTVTYKTKDGKTYYYSIDANGIIHFYNQENSVSKEIENVLDIQRIADQIHIDSAGQLPSNVKPSVAKKPSHEKLHQVQKALGAKETSSWDAETQKGWVEIIDAKYSGTDGDVNLLKTDWPKAAAKLGKAATLDGILEFIKALKNNEYSAEVPEAAPAEAKPAESAATQPVAGETQQPQFTEEDVVKILQDLASGRSSFQTASGGSVLSAERVGAQSTRFIKRLGGHTSAAKKIMENINAEAFKKMDEVNRRFNIFTQLEKLGESWLGKLFTQEAPGRLTRQQRREERRAKKKS